MNVCDDPCFFVPSQKTIASKEPWRRLADVSRFAPFHEARRFEELRDPHRMNGIRMRPQTIGVADLQTI